MFKFLFFIFFLLIVLLLLMGFSVLRFFKNILFGSGDKSQRQRQTSQRSSGNHSSQSSSSGQSYQAPSNSRRKIFAKDEGEYVDYEEIK